MTSLPAVLVTLSLLVPHALPASSKPAVRRPILAAVLAQRPALQLRTPHPIQPSPVHTSPKVRRVVVGAVLGAVAGGVLGYYATADCRCDDPGYGVLLGLPIGAIAGGVAGGLLLK